MSTALTDIIKPNFIAGYMEAVFPDVLPFVATGAAEMDFDTVGEGGDFVAVPSLVADRTRAEKNDGSKSSSVGKIQSYNDVAAIARRKRVRGVDNATKQALGTRNADLINAAIAASAARYWAEELEYAAVSVCKGVFDDTAGALKDSHRLNKAKTGSGNPVPISVNLLIDAAAKMGDNLFGIAAYAMHSKVYADFAKENQARIQTLAIGQVMVPFFDGKPIIVSDACATRGSAPLTVYQTYLLRPGALWLAMSRNIEVLYEQQAEYPREIITQTVPIIAHIKGVKWAVSTTNPENSDYETAANWAQCLIEGTATKIDNKLIGITCLETNSTLG